ncbi:MULTISPECIES: hypothetical protein [unclassified Streptomyces]|uniref:hypothetical protein n=1 Tax=unclassified Streptomyces TaxID=2593676 RepID=UPI002E1F360A|nr:hypothetical protein OG217_19615 [Streptomyces sp. NBC_01023]
MTYNLIATETATPDRLAPALGAALGVAAGDVDVADADGDADVRNWEALVLCDYKAVRGDLAWSLDIYVQDQLSQRPSEAEMASRLASATGAAVLFPAESDPPSAYWAATPEGRFTRARMLVSDDDQSYSVDAVEEYVTQLPSAEVALIPEVVPELPIATPRRDAFVAQLRASAVTEAGLQGPASPDEPGSVAWEAWTGLGAWEKLVNHMASGWEGSGWCPPDLYRRRLEARDDLENLPRQLPPAVAASLQAVLQQLDATFATLTIEDNQGLLIRQLLGETRTDNGKGWWWHRHPEPLPWRRRT